MDRPQNKPVRKKTGWRNDSRSREILSCCGSFYGENRNVFLIEKQPIKEYNLPV